MKSQDTLSAEQRRRGARVLQALAHPLRLGIMQALAETPLTCSELQARMGCPQPTLSLQLKTLVEQGLVSTCKEGTVKRCSIRNPDFLKLFVCLRRHLSEVL
ncbi:MAG: metalloregulator ArsR/SmtB family transcription factor [Kiritimatiellae bacterium]|nr:metalloregulator ArsR/SmtB family transcription factor [Kiritimatiellia bacterium]